MMFPIRNVEKLQKLNEAVSLQNQVKAVSLRDKLGEQNYHEDAKKLFKPMTDAIKDTSDNLRETLTETSIRKQSNREFKRKNFRNDG